MIGGEVKYDMRRLSKTLLKNMGFGLVYSVLAVAGAAIYTWLAGPLWGQLNAAALAFMILVIGIMGVAGLVAFFRTPNPYTRTYALYDLADVPEVLRNQLDSGGSAWLWHVAPMAVAAIVCLPFFA